MFTVCCTQILPQIPIRAQISWFVQHVFYSGCVCTCSHKQLLLFGCLFSLLLLLCDTASDWLIIINSTAGTTWNHLELDPEKGQHVCQGTCKCYESRSVHFINRLRDNSSFSFWSVVVFGLVSISDKEDSGMWLALVLVLSPSQYTLVVVLTEAVLTTTLEVGL